MPRRRTRAWRRMRPTTPASPAPPSRMNATAEPWSAAASARGGSSPAIAPTRSASRQSNQNGTSRQWQAQPSSAKATRTGTPRSRHPLAPRRRGRRPTRNTTSVAISAEHRSGALAPLRRVGREVRLARRRIDVESAERQRRGNEPERVLGAIGHHRELVVGRAEHQRDAGSDAGAQRVERRAGEQVAVDHRSPREAVLEQRVDPRERVLRIGRAAASCSSRSRRLGDGRESRRGSGATPARFASLAESVRARSADDVRQHRRQGPRRVEESLGCRHPEQCQHRAAAGGLTRDRDARRVAAECARCSRAPTRVRRASRARRGCSERPQCARTRRSPGGTRSSRSRRRRG